MTDELVLADMVRAWAQRIVPDDPKIADRAVAVAFRSYASGASMSEACWEARRFVASWSRHPSRTGAAFPPISLAS